jgi:hypothetical protein
MGLTGGGRGGKFARYIYIRKASLSPPVIVPKMGKVFERHLNAGGF